MQEKIEQAIRYLKQRGKYALNQKIHRHDSPAARRERARRDVLPIPRSLLK